ncbi:MAG: ThuA domain-containing protein [Opitutus sp.]
MRPAPSISQTAAAIRRVFVVLCAISVAPVAFCAGTADPAAPMKKVLFFSKSSNFEHSVIKRKDGQPSWAEQILAKEGPKHGITFTFSKDGSLFSAEYLAQFDAFMFYTSGDLLAPGKDGNPPMSAAGKAALLEAVEHGKGFVGVHSATDTFHTGETVATNTNQPRTWRYRSAGAQADPYIRLVGGELIVHGTQQIARVQVIDPKFPGFAGHGPAFELLEEWYSLTDFSPDLHVLLLQDTSSMRDPNADGKAWPPAGWDTPYKRPPYPSTWARRQGEGRVFYTSMGHREDTWTNPLFQDILFGGLAWALRNVDADVTANLQAVAPRAGELPPVSGPVAGLPKSQRAETPK